MGLDQYLCARNYVSAYSKTPLKAPEIVPDGYDIKWIEVEAIYWRKANWIHGWFVRNIQNGKDNCASFPVKREQLNNLLKDIKAVQDNDLLRFTTMPTKEGFFFGSTDYDEFYYQSLQRTKEDLEKVLKDFNDDWLFYYTSSW